MKPILLYLVLSFYCLTSVAQQKQIKVFKDKRIKIINLVIDKDPNKLPILTFTVSNKSKEDIIFTNVYLGISDFKRHPLSSSSNNDLISKVLNPIGGLDLPIPTRADGYMFGISSPIRIVKKDAITIAVRLYCPFANKIVVPSQLGYFKFKLSFLTDDFKSIQSEEIILGD